MKNKGEVKTGHSENTNMEVVVEPQPKKQVFVGRVWRECDDNSYRRRCDDNAIELRHNQRVPIDDCKWNYYRSVSSAETTEIEDPFILPKLSYWWDLC